MSNVYNLVCTNPDCNYRDDLSNPDQEGILSEEYLTECPKCDWPLMQRK